MGVRQEIRRHPRNAAGGKVRIAYGSETGSDNFMFCRLLDISECGMRIDSPVPLEVRSYINFCFSEPRFEGSASVRSCVRTKLRYAIGLEFSGQLKWKTQAGAMPTPASP